MAGRGARAQQPKVARIGALYIGIADEESFKRELRQGMSEQGYVEGRDVTFEFRSKEGKLDRLPDLAAELVRLKVDVSDRPAVRAQRLTHRRH